MKELKFVANTSLDRRDIERIIEDWLVTYGIYGWGWYNDSRNNRGVFTIGGDHIEVAIKNNDVTVDILVPFDQLTETDQMVLTMLKTSEQLGLIQSSS